MKHYTFELIKHALYAGRPMAAISLAYRIGRCKMARQHRLVYGLSAAEVDPAPAVNLPDYHVECIRAWADLDSKTRAELDRHKDLIYWDMRKLMDQGGKLWLGRLAGQVANLGATRTGDQMNAYFFPLLAQTAVFSHFATVPAFRGKNLFPTLLRYIMRTLAQAGMEHFYIDCTDWNIPSMRGIERAGFHLIGHGQAGRQGKLIWFQTAKPYCRGEN